MAEYDIYEPAEDSYLLQKEVEKYSFGRVLEIGTGSGIQALTASKCKDVKEVLAVDINDKAIRKLKDKLKKELILNKKVTVQHSNLFSDVIGKFNTIIFNPPYLPQDKIGKEEIIDPALYGGKKGWEISEKFFNGINKHLETDGIILFLFSSLTNKEKIEEFIKNNLLEFEQLSSKKISFEELFVYKITKSKVLRELEKKNVENIKYLTHGKRGDVYTGTINKSKLVKTHFPKDNIIKIVIKITRKESEAIGRIENETYWLKELNKINIGPHFYFSGEDYLVCEFINGKLFYDWINEENRTKKEIIKVLTNVLYQCYQMDKLKVNKEEMHHPKKHMIIKNVNNVVMIDFERCKLNEKVHNLTQFIEFISRASNELKNKKIKIDIEKLRELSKDYSEDKNNYKNIIDYLESF